MFGPNHYVPILRWKQAERFALTYLHEADRKRITPLIELIPTIFKSPKHHGNEPPVLDPAVVLEREAKRFLEACGYSPFFLDLHRVDAEIPKNSGKKHAIEYIAELARSYRLVLIPVTGLFPRRKYKSAVSRVAEKDGRGVCLRVTTSQVLDTGFANAIQELLEYLRMGPDAVHLVVDNEANDPGEPDPKLLLTRIPHLNVWQTLSLASGAFPHDLQKFQPGNTKIPRCDWQNWKSLVSTDNKAARKPSFSDYTIQYRQYEEPPEHCNPSVSIRYTLERDWLIMRGEATRGNARSTNAEVRPGREQWIAEAQLLCDDKELFYGRDFSWGDMFIHERSVSAQEGTFEIWLRAGINHHMTVVSRQIANLNVA